MPVAISMSEWIDVRKRAIELGLTKPSEFAILPRGFQNAQTPDDVTHESDASTLRKLLAEGGLDVQQLEPKESRLATHVQKSYEWIAPTFFVGSMLLSQNPHAVQIALGVIQSYITDFVKDKLPGSRVNLSFVVEGAKSKKCKHLSYEGPVSGIKDLERVIREIQND
jgi:hypothetical protein